MNKKDSGIISPGFFCPNFEEKCLAGIKWMQDGPFGIMVHYLSYICDK